MACDRVIHAPGCDGTCEDFEPDHCEACDAPPCLLEFEGEAKLVCPDHRRK